MFEDYYMPQFDMDYFNSPAFQRGIASAVQQYSPQPVEPVYYAPEPVYYAPPPAPEITAGIGDIPQYMVEDYGLIGGAPDRFTAPQISAEQLAAERYAAEQAAQQMEAQRAAAETLDAAEQAAAQYAAQQAEAQRVAAAQAAAEQAAAQQAAAAAEAQRVAAAQELAARAEAERVAAERAAAAEAAAQRQQTELNERRAQAAQAAAERAAQERALAEQAAAQAAAEAQAAAQAQAEAAAQAEAQRVAAAQAQAEAQAQAQAAEQARVQAAQQAEAQRVAVQQAEAQRVADAQAAQRAAEVQAEAQRVAAEQAAAERAASERAAAEQAAAQAEAQRVAAAQEASAKAEAERVALARAQELEAAAARTNNEVAAARAEQARIAAERATAEREAAEQASIQAEVAAQEQARVQAEQAAAVAPAPEPQPLSGIGRAVDENYYTPEVQAPEQTYTPAPVPAPAPEQAYTPAVEPSTVEVAPVAGIGSPVIAEPVYTPAPVIATEPDVVSGIGGKEVSAEPELELEPPSVSESVSTPRVQPMTVEAEPIAGIGSPVIAEPLPTAQPMVSNMRGYVEFPYDTGGGMLLPAVEAEPIAGIGSPAVAAPADTPSVIETAEVPFDPNTIDLSALDSLYGMNLDSLYGMNFASDFGGVGNRYGGIYKDDPNTEYISAPRSNRGNATGGAGNTFIMRADQPVRLVDLNTNTVIYEGTGYDAAREATRLGQNLSDTMGRKAQYNIQTANPAGEYTTVANEKKNKSTLGQIANVAGTVLPLAMMAIPGVNAALLGANFAKTLGGQLAFGALTGGASSALKGQNILKGAALGGLTAAGGALIPKIPAIGDLGKLAKPLGTGIGATVGGLATGQNLKNSLLGGVASGALAYAAPGIQDAIKGIGQGPNLSTGSAPSATPSATPSGPAPIATVTANTGVSAPVSFGGGSSPQTKVAELEPPATIVSGSGSPFAASFPIPANVPSGALPSTLQQPKTEIPTDEEMTEIPTDEEMKEILVRANQSYLSPDVLAGMAEFEKNPIISEGSKITNTGGLNLDLGVLDRVSDMEMENYKEPIVVEGSKIEPVSVSVVPPLDPLPPLDLKPDPALTEKSTLDKLKDAYDIARVGAALLPLISGGGGGGGGTLTPDTTGINFTKSPLRPTTPAGGIGGISGAGGYPYTPQTYGRRGGDQETEYLFFTRDPVTGQELLQSTPAPITTPIANESAGPSMYAPDVDNTRFAEGGEVDDDMVKHLVDYHKNGGHRGSGQVKGIGSGQEDKIPAYLSDGEYVWSAQDVSDLGDGSNREGVRRLDKMRQMVRSQAGRKDVKKIAKPQKGIDRMLKAVGGMA
jgi:hypothetical protein